MFIYFRNKPTVAWLRTTNITLHRLQVSRISKQKMLQVKGNRVRILYILIIKPTSCTNFSNLFLE